MNFSTFLLVAIRSLFLEASWNPRGQQNLGLAAAVDPALKAIHKSGEELLAARRRILLNIFNTNPISSGIAIGVVIKLEEHIAEGRLDAKGHRRFMSSLGFALASLGDAFFWQAWLPLCALIAIWAVLSFEASLWPPLLLPGLFCLVAWPVRFVGFYLGYKKGPDVFDLLDALKITYAVRYLKRIIAIVLGASTSILISSQTGWRGDNSLFNLWLAAGGVCATVYALRLWFSKRRLLAYWYPAIIILGAGAAILARSQGLF